MKMQVMLIQQGMSAVLAVEEEQEARGREDGDERAQLKRAEILAKAHSVVILCLGDKVLREVAKETTAAGILTKLESLYMRKSLANRLYMKQRLYSYRFLEDKSMIEQLEEFNKAIDDLENIDVSVGDEDKAIMLLNTLPKSYDQMRDAILYGRDRAITLLEVQSALRAKELHKDGQRIPQDPAAESLNVKKFKGKKFQKKDSFKPSGIEKNETRSCHWCKKPGHLKNDCYDWKRKQSAFGIQGKNSTDCTEEVEVSEILNVMEDGEGSSWIMDSGCSFHMCPNLDWFEDITESTGSVVLGNNQRCCVKGVGTVRLKMCDGSVKLLSDVRYIPDIKRNLISLGLLEVKGCSFTSSDGSDGGEKGKIKL